MNTEESINQILNQTFQTAQSKTEDWSNYKAFKMLAKEFKKYSIPIKYIADININVDDEFFQEEHKAQQIIENLGEIINNLHLEIKKEFQHDYIYIFPKLLQKISLNFNSEL